MIERASEFGAAAAAPLTTGDTSFLTAGDMLRQAREAHNLHIEVVAAALKVPVQKMEALEENRIEDLPDPVFARALAASVARALRIDPAPVLAKMAGAKRDGLADADRTMSGNIREHALRSGRGESWTPSKPLLIAVGLLLVAAAVVFWLPQSLFDRVGASLSQATKGADGGKAADAETGPVAAVAPGTVVESVAPNAAAPSAAAPAAAPAVQDAAPAAAAGADVLSFSARAESWVTVTEPGGKVLLKRSVKAGETVGVTGTLPLSVVVGRASVIDVQVRGKAFDLAPVTRAGGVARFEIKP